ncbi:MAG: hypothetical protein M3083_03770 [Actinomycetota bacterium]|nr:hypothetical protein [Actinomycetota bacterium]
MYDYVDGKVDWMAYGLAVEGDDGPFLGERVAAVPTCAATGSVADAREVMDRSGAEVVVVHGGGLAVGEVDGEALAGKSDDVPLLEVLRPVPGTVRPSVTVASVAEAGAGRRLVTTADGRLLGQATVAAADHDDDHDHESHDHEGHDHGEVPLDMGRYELELTEVMKAVGERFGDREPPADELRAFLHDRLVAEGRSVEEADRFLDGLAAEAE